MINTRTLRTSTGVVSMLSILPHLFCCGIPAVAALISLGTTAGLAAGLATNPFYQLVDTWHTQLIMLAVGSVVLSGVLNLVAWRLDCREAARESLVHGHCTHGDCAPRKNTSLKILLLSTLLLMLDLTWFFTEEHVLGLHHHGAEAHAEHTETGHAH